MKPINILIVEDDRVAAKTLALNLKHYNYQVIGIVNSGIKAIEKVTETQPDLILMDIVLKGTMDGVATSEKIQSAYNIPIIYLSSCSERDTLKRARKTKPKGYLIKPYKPEDLKATIESALQHYDPIKSNLKRISRKAKLATFKVKQIARQNFNLPSLSGRDRSIKRTKYRDRLPQLSREDAQIVSTEVASSLGYTSGFVSDRAIAEIISPQNWKTCAAKAGSIIITNPCNVFHRAKPAQRNRYSITFGYTSRIPKVFLSEFQLSPKEWNRITPQLSKRQIACLRRSK